MLCGYVSAPAQVQVADQDEINPAEVRPFWLGSGTALEPAAAPYTLTEQERNKFKGTFGVDLSHYTFDRGDKAECKTQEGYNTAACSCCANWEAVANAGIINVYSKASDGAGTDLSFKRVWSELEQKHASKVLFRGAYHFLWPGVDANVQADAFLKAVGATEGRKPAQLPPALDIEWSNKRIELGTQEFNSCPVSRRTQIARDKWVCDMWYKVKPSVIASMARTWIDRVEATTGRPVIVYTNPTAWWNVVMTPNENRLLRARGVWTSRYTSVGPQYNNKWTTEGGSPKWKMAPLPRGASYPTDSYSKPHLWQFTENGLLPVNVLTCGGSARNKEVDMNWVPITTDQFQDVFAVATK
jgi:GH25 family lysozyme M1 (1,4-beta-N-acetylmuramidase)